MARKTMTDRTEDPEGTAGERQERVTTTPETAGRAPRPGSKLAQVIAMLEDPEGATIAEIMAATGWQQHSVRGALAGAIAKKLHRVLTSDKVEGRVRVYRIAPSPA